MPPPAKLSKRDARYLNLYEIPVGAELFKKFGKSDGFSIAEASEKLETVAFLHYTTRYDVAGAVVRALRLNGTLIQTGKKFSFAVKSKRREP